MDNVPRIGVLTSQISVFILILIISCKVLTYCNVTRYWRLWPDFFKFDPSDLKSWIRHWVCRKDLILVHFHLYYIGCDYSSRSLLANLKYYQTEVCWQMSNTIKPTSVGT